MENYHDYNILIFENTNFIFVTMKADLDHEIPEAQEPPEDPPSSRMEVLRLIHQETKIRYQTCLIESPDESKRGGALRAAKQGAAGRSRAVQGRTGRRWIGSPRKQPYILLFVASKTMS